MGDDTYNGFIEPGNSFSDCNIVYFCTSPEGWNYVLLCKSGGGIERWRIRPQQVDALIAESRAGGITVYDNRR